jgi:hypothetical protein
MNCARMNRPGASVVAGIARLHVEHDPLRHPAREPIPLDHGGTEDDRLLETARFRYEGTLRHKGENITISAYSAG